MIMTIPHALSNEPAFRTGYEYAATELAGEHLDVLAVAAQAMRAELEQFSQYAHTPAAVALYGGLHWLREQGVWPLTPR